MEAACELSKVREVIAERHTRLVLSSPSMSVPLNGTLAKEIPSLWSKLTLRQGTSDQGASIIRHPERQVFGI